MRFKVFEHEGFCFFEAPDGSFWFILALLGRSDPKMGFKMSFNMFIKSGKKKCVTNDLKKVQIWVRFFFPKTVQNEIAGLRQFLPSTHYVSIFLCILCIFWGSLGSLIGHLEALLGGLWTQKPLKTLGFLRFLKRLFEAPHGPLGLILAHSG